MPLTQSETFYDEHPFDWVERYDAGEVRSVFAPLLAKFLEGLAKEKLVLDVGCGGGRVMTYMSSAGQRCIGLDRSHRSVQIMMGRCPVPGVVADNLTLPFADGSVDCVVSDGVVHHTQEPVRAFRENCRILRAGGLMYFAVYKPGGRYEFLYRFPGSWIRRMLRSGATRWLVHATALSFYYAVHWLRSRGRVTWRGARHLFYDYFASPRVAFLSREVVEEWAAGNGMKLVSFDPSPGLNVHAFVFEKAGAQEAHA